MLQRLSGSRGVPLDVTVENHDVELQVRVNIKLARACDIDDPNLHQQILTRSVGPRLSTSRRQVCTHLLGLVVPADTNARIPLYVDEAQSRGLEVRR